ncbi:MAG: matrixin family metalloprotease [Planctomycetes bacterium]|nr:matrixin family metalloprotease [Planctomycetota bacterium]
MTKRNGANRGAWMCMLLLALLICAGALERQYGPAHTAGGGPSGVGVPCGVEPGSATSPHVAGDGLTALLNLSSRLAARDDLLETIDNLRIPVAVCFAPGTPPEVMAAYQQAMIAEVGPLAYFLGPRWPGSQGSGKALTWSFVPDGLQISAGTQGETPGPSELFAEMDAQFGGNRALWIARFEESFARWQQLTGNTYTRITFGGNDWDDGASWGTGSSANRGDLRIAMKLINGSGGVLAYNYFPSNGDMVLDSADFWAGSTNNYRFLRNVVMHEHGHGMGLQHVCSSDSNQLMEPFINTSFDGPQHDDLRAAQRHYGDPFEVDDATVDATDLGGIAIGSPVSFGATSIPAPSISDSSIVTIDGEGKQDWYKFTVSSARSATVTLTPRGRIYDSSPQNADSSCSSGNSIDSRAMANLNVELIDADQTTVLGTGDAQPAGAAEVLADVYLPVAGEYYVRVFEGPGVTTESQFYDLQVAAEPTLPCQGVFCDNGNYCDGLEFCDLGTCFDGPPPCGAGQGCDEANDVCFDLPGACCLPEGVCELRDAALCPTSAGYYYGNGTDCAGPLNPTCVPADPLVTCQPGATELFAGESVPVSFFVEEIDNVSSFQVKLKITQTAGTGTLSVACPDGARINERICISSTTFEPTGNTCDAPLNCPSGELCVGRPDYLFFGLSTVGGVACDFLEFAMALLNFGTSVTVGATPAYLADATFEVSGDATPGTTFEVTLERSHLVSLFNQPSGDGIPFRIGPPCVITVLDPAGCNTPIVEAEGSRYLKVTPRPSIIAQALEVQGDPLDPAVSCVSAFVQADGTLGPNPVFQTSAQWGTVHVRGDEIIPSSEAGSSIVPTSYRVRAYCNPDYSSFATASTWLWGDVNNNDIVNFADIQLMVLKFQGLTSAVSLENVDLHPCEPNHVINFADIQLDVLIFQGDTYADSGCPIPCP